ncbi:hypothetical protein B0H11DRAFT_2405443 [Mycena galericulata]|nr:hypothetical protein B0H11DRAFT_2405443 [Mycena galericulata]
MVNRWDVTSSEVGAKPPSPLLIRRRRLLLLLHGAALPRPRSSWLFIRNDKQRAGSAQHPARPPIRALHPLGGLDVDVGFVGVDGVGRLRIHTHVHFDRSSKSEEVGYIPAENIETPFEHLARLNKHRNVDSELNVSASRLRTAMSGPQGNSSSPLPPPNAPRTGNTVPNPLSQKRGLAFSPALSVHRYPPAVWNEDEWLLEREERRAASMHERDQDGEYTGYDDTEDDDPEDEWEVGGYEAEDRELADEMVMMRRMSEAAIAKDAISLQQQQPQPQPPQQPIAPPPHRCPWSPMTAPIPAPQVREQQPEVTQAPPQQPPLRAPRFVERLTPDIDETTEPRKVTVTPSIVRDPVSPDTQDSERERERERKRLRDEEEEAARKRAKPTPVSAPHLPPLPTSPIFPRFCLCFALPPHPHANTYPRFSLLRLSTLLPSARMGALVAMLHRREAYEAVLAEDMRGWVARGAGGTAASAATMVASAAGSSSAVGAASTSGTREIEEAGTDVNEATYTPSLPRSSLPYLVLSPPGVWSVDNDSVLFRAIDTGASSDTSNDAPAPAPAPSRAEPQS